MIFCTRLLLVAAMIASFAARAEVAVTPEEEAFNLARTQAYEGQIIDSIKFTGLKRTKDRAARWLLNQHEGDAYNHEKWIVGIHKLYDTGVLYEISTNIKPADQVGHITIEVSVRDRWALLPYGVAQSGGGSNDIGGGVFDSNLFGYFATVSAGASTFDNAVTYDLNYYQEFVADTNFILGLDVSGTGTPVTFQDNHGNAAGDITWSRQQEQLLFGNKLQPHVRLFSYFETYSDRVLLEHQSQASIYTAQQYRVRPVLILGRSELTNFLEQGQELTFAPTSANFFNHDMQYSTLVASYKRTLLAGNTNYAGFFGAGTMTSAPVPYQFRLGGFDTVRGFSTNRVIGRSYVTSSLEYRPYLTHFDMPVLHWVGEVVVQGCIFQDAAMMWNANDFLGQNQNSSLGLVSQGAGLRFNFLRFTGAIARFDIARTMTPNEGIGASFGVGQFF